MRGKAFWGIHVVIRQGITPAYAGKSDKISSKSIRVKDHPRLCGEKMLQSNSVSPFSGSPPPMRGKVIIRIVFCETCRITPAYAGKRSFPCPSASGFRGSPPPMRGKAVSMQSPPTRYRITPAYAGKSPHARGQTCHGQDHPRLCGEKQFRAVPPDGYIGSPPPMRGKDVTALVKIQFQRITPAYAGKRNPD